MMLLNFPQADNLIIQLSSPLWMKLTTENKDFGQIWNQYYLETTGIISYYFM